MKKGNRKNPNAFKRLSNAFKRFPNAFQRVRVFFPIPLFIRKVKFTKFTNVKSAKEGRGGGGGGAEGRGIRKRTSSKRIKSKR